MLAFLVALVVIGERVRVVGSPTFSERVWVVWPQDLYLAWISVALIANSFQYVHVVRWSGGRGPGSANPPGPSR